MATFVPGDNVHFVGSEKKYGIYSPWSIGIVRPLPSYGPRERRLGAKRRRWAWIGGRGIKPRHLQYCVPVEWVYVAFHPRGPHGPYEGFFNVNEWVKSPTTYKDPTEAHLARLEEEYSIGKKK